MFCTACGYKAGDAKFCPGCGAVLSGDEERMKKADEVEYNIHGEDLQFVEIMLDPSETIIAEAGAMMYMDAAIKMNTIFGDGSGKEGNDLKSKLFSAGKRMITGESLFMTSFTNTAAEKRCTAFAAPYPGKVVAFNLGEHGGTMICQRDSFLCPRRIPEAVQALRGRFAYRRSLT